MILLICVDSGGLITRHDKGRATQRGVLCRKIKTSFARCDLQNKTICDLSLEKEVIEYKPTELQKICSSDDEITGILISRRMKSGLIIPNFKAYLYQIYFTLYQAASILFHLEPYGNGNEVINSDIKAIQVVLIQYVENGMLAKSKIDTVQDDTLGNIRTAQKHHISLKVQ